MMLRISGGRSRKPGPPSAGAEVLLEVCPERPGCLSLGGCGPSGCASRMLVWFCPKGEVHLVSRDCFDEAALLDVGMMEAGERLERL